MKLVVGLGNPGPRYETTRHNIGFITADFLADKLGVDFKAASKHQSLVAEGRWQQEKIIIAKPQTYMNLSGQAVGSLLHWYKLQPQDLIVIYDDLDLAVGRLRIRNSGSSGGQKGMGNIIQILGTEKIQRVRLGIGRPPQGWQTADYVLSGFSDNEWKILQNLLPKAAEAVLTIISDGLEKAMNNYNC
ncbi:aminoacyl-tRNA hydrolase [Bacillota bacterium LX-D]|nr:aminoacyl-tRNA hydrolase [Bacillota bacterium LX-D]